MEKYDIRDMFGHCIFLYRFMRKFRIKNYEILNNLIRGFIIIIILFINLIFG